MKLYRCRRCDQTVVVDLLGEMTDQQFDEKFAAHEPRCQTPEDGLGQEKP